MTSITMTLSSPNVELKEGKGSLTASVTNGSVGPERVVVAAFPGQVSVPPQPSYSTIADPLRTIPPGATEQYVVAFDTTGAVAGSYPVKLLAYSADRAPDDYADQAHVITLAVPNAPAPPPPKRGFPWLWVIIGGVVLLAVIGGVIWFFLKDATVPNVLDKPQAEAVQILKDAGFPATITTTESVKTSGTVIGQSPEGTKSAGRGSTVTLQVAIPGTATVPPVLGKTLAEATQMLQDAGFSVESAEKESTVTAGQVFSQEPGFGSTAERGSTVRLDVAVPALTTVPDIMGKSIDDAKAALSEAKLTLKPQDPSQCQEAPAPRTFSACVVVGVAPDVGVTLSQGASVVVETRVDRLFNPGDVLIPRQPIPILPVPIAPRPGQ